MTVARHCEPVKQSSVLMCIWIASQARNDGENVIASLRSNPEYAFYLESSVFLWNFSTFCIYGKRDLLTKII